MYGWILKYPLLVQVFKLSSPFNQSLALNPNFQTWTKRVFSLLLKKVYIYFATSQNTLHDTNITVFSLPQGNFHSVVKVTLLSEKHGENCYSAEILKWCVDSQHKTCDFHSNNYISLRTSLIKELRIDLCKICSNRVTTEPREERTVFTMGLDCKKRVFLKNLLYAHSSFPLTVSTGLVRSQVPDVILPLPLLGGGFAERCLHRVSNTHPKAQRLAK